MNWVPLDKRYKLRKTGQAKFVCLCSDTDFPYARQFMETAYGPGQAFWPSDRYQHVANNKDWFYSWKRGNARELGLRDFKIYCRREEQKAYLMLKMLNVDWMGNWIGPQEFIIE